MHNSTYRKVHISYTATLSVCQCLAVCQSRYGIQSSLDEIERCFTTYLPSVCIFWIPSYMDVKELADSRC